MLDAQLLAHVNSAGPDWLVDARAEAFEVFADSSPPSQKDELWRYVDLDFELLTRDVAGDPGPGSVDEEMATGGFAGVALLRDGYLTKLEDASGVMVPLSERQRPWANPVPPDVDIFSAAHTAFLQDGVAIRIPRGVVLDQPLLVSVASVGDGSTSFPHVDLELEENSEATVIIEYTSQVDHVSVPQLTATVGQSARARVVSLQRGGEQLRSIAHYRARVERDASFQLAEAGLGGGLARLHLTIDLDGAGASANVDSVYYGEHTQTLDYRAFVHHRGANTSSELFLKGAVQDSASSVFTGLIKIHPEAAGTSAFQTNRNLVLSDGAVAQSVPNLEILCDDVVCGHASTSGPLEDEHLYYLMSRGLGPERAETLLVRGFFDEVLTRFPGTVSSDDLRREIQAKFGRRRP